MHTKHPFRAQPEDSYMNIKLFYNCIHVINFVIECRIMYILFIIQNTTGMSHMELIIGFREMRRIS